MSGWFVRVSLLCFPRRPVATNTNTSLFFFLQCAPHSYSPFLQIHIITFSHVIAIFSQSSNSWGLEIFCKHKCVIIITGIIAYWDTEQTCNRKTVVSHIAEPRPGYTSVYFSFHGEGILIKQDVSRKEGRKCFKQDNAQSTSEGRCYYNYSKGRTTTDEPLKCKWMWASVIPHVPCWTAL